MLDTEITQEELLYGLGAGAAAGRKRPCLHGVHPPGSGRPGAGRGRPRGASLGSDRSAGNAAVAGTGSGRVRARAGRARPRSPAGRPAALGRAAGAAGLAVAGAVAGAGRGDGGTRVRQRHPDAPARRRAGRGGSAPCWRWALRHRRGRCRLLRDRRRRLHLLPAGGEPGDDRRGGSVGGDAGAAAQPRPGWCDGWTDVRVGRLPLPGRPPARAGRHRPARRAGELVLVVGESGCGKSTLLRAATGLVPHFHGGELSGRVHARRQGHARRAARPSWRAHAGLVFQDPEAQLVTERALSRARVRPREPRDSRRT